MAAFTSQDRQQVKQNAREKLKGNLGMPCLAVVIVGLILGALNSTYTFKTPDGNVSAASSIPSIISYIISGFMSFGLASFFLKFIREGKAQLESLFDGVKNIGGCIIAGILTILITALGLILFIVPGIIFALRYSMTFYILVDNPGMSATDAMKRSKEMMAGHLVELFVFELSFILWYLGVAVTFGILYFYVGPYYATAKAMFYEKLRPAKEEEIVNNQNENVTSDDLFAFRSDAEEDVSASNDPFSDVATHEKTDDDDDFFAPSDNAEANDDTKKDDDIFF